VSGVRPEDLVGAGLWIVRGVCRPPSAASLEIREGRRRRLVGWRSGSSLPTAASLAPAPGAPAARSSPIAAATALVIASRSDGLADPPSAIWPMSGPTRKIVVVELVDGLSTS
jgi:hypothetical protein